MKTRLHILIPVLCLSILASCNSRPRVIESESEETTEEAVPSLDNLSPASATRKVTVKEVLNTERYNYLRVDEDGNEYWIAVLKMEVEVGGIYLFRDGLLKKNFHSQEHDRDFETLYLVSNIWKYEDASQGPSATEEMPFDIKPGEELTDEVGDIEPAPGAVRIAELLANKEKYRDRPVKVTGKCVKVNPMIMNRNWVHLKDGSNRDADLVVTTAEIIPLGAVVTLEGTIALDKDFGAGYRYDIIMESAVIK